MMSESHACSTCSERLPGRKRGGSDDGRWTRGTGAQGKREQCWMEACKERNFEIELAIDPPGLNVSRRPIKHMAHAARGATGHNTPSARR